MKGVEAPLKLKIILLSLVLAAALSIPLISLSLRELGKPEITVSIIEAHGECGLGERKLWLIKVEDGYALLGYSEPASNPCYRHFVESVKILSTSPLVIEVKLGRRSSPELCAACLGTIVTELRVGPVKPGETTIIVNGLSVRV